MSTIALIEYLLPMLMLTARDRIENAVSRLNADACDRIISPVFPELQLTVDQFLQLDSEIDSEE
ncbi:hypothetical protein JOY44_12035 [Phormidium sp. CLA17]|uniref:hypothetical protein n=1 Tax=Leptolyngbya sp. Cla-17 TaxID=2803751 RepID=UPI001490CAD8|nr:hypothetical protein [Leptolyngbya sp. Cla-17]MBM0742339.1 hypothetical protein [Leptolyngbya sp. Cla-17]